MDNVSIFANPKRNEWEDGRLPVRGVERSDRIKIAVKMKDAFSLNYLEIGRKGHLRQIRILNTNPFKNCVMVFYWNIGS
ncbi:hypothetical protein [Pontiella agarivorans]|uniref:Uncharacterized protein n=1 Tax=Pontiella agarivorans TaxID=3038953 RepID=A0ABU5MUN6_9BACT|nr:hypothetical protein [Pontiella agarivorans]MDZ8117842.1 hypothetical protein [Pontiella agarivorans]